MTLPADGWPVDPGVLPAFLLAMVLVELTPGPNMGYLAAITAGRGRTAGLITIAGVTLGLAVYLALSVLGLAEAAHVSPGALIGLRWGGVVYMSWMAADALRTPAPSAGPARPTLGSTTRLVLRGFLANLLNPKAAIFYIVILPGFLRPGFGPPWRQALTLGVLHLAISIAVHLTVVFGTAGATRTLSGPGRRWLRWLSAAGLAAVAVWLALEQRPFG